MKTLTTVSEIASALPPVLSRVLSPKYSVWPVFVICTPLWGVEESLVIWVLGWRGAEVPPFPSPLPERCPGPASWRPSTAGTREESDGGSGLARVAAQRASAVLRGQEEVVTCTVPGLGALPTGLCFRASVCPHPGPPSEPDPEASQSACACGGSGWPAARAGARASVLRVPGPGRCRRKTRLGSLLPAHCSYWEPRDDLAAWAPVLQRRGALGPRGLHRRSIALGVGDLRLELGLGLTGWSQLMTEAPGQTLPIASPVPVPVLASSPGPLRPSREPQGWGPL